MHITDEAQTAGSRLSKKLDKKTRQTKGELKSVLSSVRNRISARTPEINPDKLKDHMKLQLSDWGNSVRHEAKNALKTSRVKSKRMIRKRSLLSLGVAVGIGAALGYIAAHQQQEAD